MRRLYYNNHARCQGCCLQREATAKQRLFMLLLPEGVCLMSCVCFMKKLKKHFETIEKQHTAKKTNVSLMGSVIYYSSSIHVARSYSLVHR